MDNIKGPHTGPFFAPSWNLGRITLKPQNRPLVMGILNLTPDSFFDGGKHASLEPALKQAQSMISAGADVLDLGAESSRPGADSVSQDEEIQRLLPVLKTLRKQTDIPVTVDTVRPETARVALDEGADAINDISGGQDPQMLDLAAQKCCGIILMHMKGKPLDMQDSPRYQDAVTEVSQWLHQQCRKAEEMGVQPGCLMVDPGIGFGKTLQHNLELMKNLKDVAKARPLLLGASRKSFISHLTEAPVENRLPGSLAALAAAHYGNATMVRVHDVAESIQFLEVLSHIRKI